MTERINEKIVSPELDSLFDALLTLTDRDQCYRFFSDLCTFTELDAMGQRFAVAKMLKSGYTYSEIGKKLGASSATIGRVNRALSYGAGGYASVLESSEENK